MHYHYNLLQTVLKYKNSLILDRSKPAHFCSMHCALWDLRYTLTTAVSQNIPLVAMDCKNSGQSCENMWGYKINDSD